jgi:hypothetical protein
MLDLPLYNEKIVTGNNAPDSFLFHGVVGQFRALWEAAMGKKKAARISEVDISALKAPKMVSWETARQDMTEEELETIKNMNWEWYYHCYLYLDEIIPIACKRCGQINVFQPREKKKTCKNCGAETKRCEKEEKL